MRRIQTIPQKVRGQRRDEERAKEKNPKQGRETKNKSENLKKLSPNSRFGLSNQRAYVVTRKVDQNQSSA